MTTSAAVDGALERGTVAHALPNRILLRCPEITLKGKNRGTFERRLLENVVRRLRRGGFDWPVHYAHGRIYVDIREPERAAEAAGPLTEVVGIDSLATAVWLRPRLSGQSTGDLDEERVERTLVVLADRAWRGERTFAVRVHRVDKRLPRTSQEMEVWLGGVLQQRSRWREVDLDAPDVTFHVDIYPDGVYLYSDRRHGFGGLPVGSSSRVLALLSGGIDSPVAAFMMAKRGCTVDLFHMTASHAQLRDESSSIFRLAERLSRFTVRSRLFAVPSTRFELALGDPGTGFEPILFRRFLARTAERLAGRLGAAALITGDSLGQVASQTMENLVSASDAVAMPILRPLIAFNKEETIALARRLGTFDISIEPYKDCCALLARRPRTRSVPQRLRELEERLLPAANELLGGVLEDAVWRPFDCGEAVGGWRELEA